MDDEVQNPSLRRGWTTGACATAAAKAAYTALLTGEFPDPVEILLPGGQRPSFALASHDIQHGLASAGIVKDAGDDPDVTHNALIMARVRKLAEGSGVVFKAGKGVGTVTKPGLPLNVGEPAINPMPRNMLRYAIEEVAKHFDTTGDVEIEISVPNGEALAQKTMNPRLGILGGISILGTTGIVIPFSCSAWIHAIYRGIDVARAEGLQHLAGATGSTTEKAIQQMHILPESALIDMGDFVGGMLKDLKTHPVAKVTVAGGFAKMTKLAQGMIDLHSRAGEVDLAFLANVAQEAGVPEEIVQQITSANTAKHALDIADAHSAALATAIVERGWQTAAKLIAGTNIALEVVAFDREGSLLASTGFKAT